MKSLGDARMKDEGGKDDTRMTGEGGEGEEGMMDEGLLLNLVQPSGEDGRGRKSLNNAADTSKQKLIENQPR